MVRFFFFLLFCFFAFCFFFHPLFTLPSRPKMIKGKQGKKDKETHGAIHEFAMNKSLGQNLLKNPQILDSIIEKAGLKSTDTVSLLCCLLFFLLWMVFLKVFSFLLGS